MSYTYPTGIYYNIADVGMLATQLAQRQSDSGTTNGGIVAGGGSATVPQLGVDADNLGLAYMKGIADSILAACGYQGQSDVQSTNSSTTSTTYVDCAGFSSYAFSAPINKTYLVNIHCSAFLSAGSPAQIYWQLVVGSTTYATTQLMFMDFAANNVRERLTWTVPVAMVAGSNTIKLQWKVSVGTATANVQSGADGRIFTVSG